MAIARVKPPASDHRLGILCATTASSTPTVANATAHFERYQSLGFNSVGLQHTLRMPRVAWDPYQLKPDGTPDPAKPYRSGIRNPTLTKDTNGYTWPDQRLVDIWNAAGALGLHREHRLWPSTGVWRGSLTPYTPDPAGVILPDTLNAVDGNTVGDGHVPVREALDLWFASYHAHQVYFATLLAPHATSEDHFIVGSEFRTLTRPSRWLAWNVTQFWRDLIAAVRAVWPGPLVYGADWGSGVTGYKTEADWIEFWNDLDYLGIHNYQPMTSGYAERVGGHLVEPQDIDERLRRAFTDFTGNTYNWYGPTGYLKELSDRWGAKKLLVEEFGAPSYRQRQYETSPPSSTDDGLKTPVTPIGAPPASQPQRLNYTPQPQASFVGGHRRAAWQLPDVVAGMYDWQGFINTTLGIQPTVGTDHRTADKPRVEKMISWLNHRTAEGLRDAIVKWPDTTAVWTLNDATTTLAAAKGGLAGRWLNEGHLSYVGWHDHALWSAVPDTEWDERLDAALAAGANSIRIDAAHASLEEDGPVPDLDTTTGDDGAFHRNRLRALLELCGTKRIGAVVMLQHTPSWLGATTASPPSDGGTAFARVAAWIATLSPAVKAVQVMNEPNLTDSWTGSVNQMTALHGLAYDAIKAANPAMPVLTAGLSTGASYSTWLTGYATVAAKVDGVAFHPYVGDDSGATCVAAIATFKTAKNATALAAKETWVTEFGWTTSAADPARPWTTGWTVTEAAKNANISAVLVALATDEQVAGAFLYSGPARTDGDTFNAGFSVLGAGPAYTPKLSAGALNDGILSGSVALQQTPLLTGEGGHSVIVTGGGHGAIPDDAALRQPGSFGVVWKPASTSGTQRLLEKQGAYSLRQTPAGFQGTVETTNGTVVTVTGTIPPVADTSYEVWVTHHDDEVTTRVNAGMGQPLDQLVTTKTRRLNLVVNGDIQASALAPGDIAPTNTDLKIGQGAAGTLELAWTANGWPSNTTGGAFRSISPLEMEALHIESNFPKIVAPPASNYEALVASQGRKSHWRAKETAGVDLADTTGFQTGTLIGGVTVNQTPGAIVGEAEARYLALNGTTGKATFGTALAEGMTGTQPFWLETWIRPHAVVASGRIWSWEDASVTQGVQLTHSSTSINFSRIAQTLDTDGVTVIGSFETASADIALLALNQWNHIVAQYLYPTLSIFINGLLVASRTSTQSITIPLASPLTLGAKASGGGYINADVAEPAVGVGTGVGQLTEFEIMDRWVLGSGNDAPQAAHVANGRRQGQYRWGQSNVRGSALADPQFAGGYRIALPEPMPIDRVCVGFNMAGVNFDVGDTRHGYGAGTGGKVVAGLYPVKPDGTPDFASLIEQDKWEDDVAVGEVPAQTRYNESKARYAPTASKTQLIEQRFGHTTNLPAELYWVWFHNEHPDPANNYVSINSPTVISHVAGPHASNNLNSLEPGALMGLDPREVCGWMVDAIMYWGLEFGRGPVAGGPRWAHQTVGAPGDESNGCRLPWYVLFRTPTSEPEPYQPYYGYFNSTDYPTQGQYTVKFRIANQAAVLRYAGGYPPKGVSLGNLTVGNLKTGVTATTPPVGQATGPRLPYQALSQPITVLPGEGYFVSNISPTGGRVQLAAGDNFIRTTGKLSPTSGFWPVETTGLTYKVDGSTLEVEPTDGAQLFALTSALIDPYMNQTPKQSIAPEAEARARRPFGQRGRGMQVGVS